MGNKFYLIDSTIPVILSGSSTCELSLSSPSGTDHQRKKTQIQHKNQTHKEGMQRKQTKSLAQRVYMQVYNTQTSRVADPDPYPDLDWIRIQSGQWIRIQEGKNDPQK